MSGPGWMPSRPRPLARIRRGLWAYTPGYARRKRPRRTPTAVTAREPIEPVERAGFNVPPSDLPIAILLPRASQSRYRALGGDLRHWVAPRWAWIRPRAVPLVGAIVGMFAMIGLENYLSALARGDHAPLTVCQVGTTAMNVIDLSRPAPECSGGQLRQWKIVTCNSNVTIAICP
jgi:hypothetical protein